MRFRHFLGLIPAVFVTALSAATGDLLVAPTRIVLDGARGTEIILDNIGDAPATYRISLELRRMNAGGTLDDVATTAATEKEAKALSIISYAPRRIVLVPNQPQAIRVHMLFRAIPEAKPATAATSSSGGMSVALVPIYGVTIPIIVRQGSLKATAGMSDARLSRTANGGALTLTLSRTGDRSTYGRIRVLKSGKSQPVFEAGGIAIYPEVTKRSVEFGLPEAALAALAGPVTIQYIEDPDAGGKVLAELQTVLR
jgi:P pilus assembly chaperone PapD